MTEEIELIKHAAVKSEDGWIFIGKCHADCFHKMHHLRVKSSQKAENQGFVTSSGRYVQRAEAFQIALTSNQIKDKRSAPLDPDLFDTGPVNNVRILFSEDLWCPQYGGQFEHDEIKGYY